MLQPHELVERIKSYNPTVDEKALTHAYDFALQAHGAQKRASGEEFFLHPLAVAEILSEMSLDEASIISALLHDTVEDTGITIDKIKTEFGIEVTELVDGVTKLSRIEKQTEEVKQAESLRKLILAMAKDIRVLLIKLADRLHNMRTLSFFREPGKRRRIARETLDIYTPLAERIGIQKIKDELEDLAFAELNPDARNSILTLTQQRRSEGQNRIYFIIQELESLLYSQGLPNITVTGRQKSPYSIWCKLKQKQLTFSQLEDIMAFRVILENVEQCYQVLGILHGHYPIVPGRFKDYISLPKTNGYKSLHTCVIGPSHERIEIQIRTQDMHEVCELGVAAHWAYKQQTQNFSPELQHLVEGLREIAQNSHKSEEFLEHTKLELYTDRVFCFTPQGDLIVLPKGATPVDFAYAVHSEIGTRCTGAQINGVMQPLRTPLQNGDIVEILTSKTQTPSPDWERFVVTGKAKSYIRRFLVKQKKPEYILLGKQMLQKVFRQEGREFSEKNFSSVLKTLQMSSLDDLFANIGKGIYGSREIFHLLYPESKVSPDQDLLILEKTQTQSHTKSLTDISVPILGLIPGMAVHYARCCHPLVGDPIKGIITTGKGVTIHTSDCETLETFHHRQERLIDVEWSDSWGEQQTSKNNDVSGNRCKTVENTDTKTLKNRKKKADKHGEGQHAVKNIPLIGRINVILISKQNCMSILSTMIEKNQGRITNMKFITRNPDFFEMLVDIEVRDVNHLNTIIAVLRSRQIVSEVSRPRGH